MPNNYLKKISKEKNIPIKKLEKIWDEAIDSVDPKFKENYAYVTAVFQKMANIKESTDLKEEWYDDLKYSTSHLRGKANVHGLNDPEETPQILINKRVTDRLTWLVLKYMTAPIEKLPAYREGFIDENGIPTSKKPTGANKLLYNSFVKVLLALRFSLSKLTSKQRLSLTLQRLFLLRDHHEKFNHYGTILQEMTSSGDIATTGGTFKMTKEMLALIKMWEEGLR